MKPEDFVAAAHQHLVSEYIHELKGRLDTPAEKILNKEWQTVVRLLHELPPEQMKAVMGLARVVATDTLSGVLGVLDGSSCMMEEQPKFELTDCSGNLLNGDLQEIFLSAIPESEYLSEQKPIFGSLNNPLTTGNQR